LKFFNLREFEIKEQFLSEVVHNKWNTDKLDSIIKDDTFNGEIYLQHDFPEVGNKKIVVAIERIINNEKKETASMIISFKEQNSG
jgi:two-component system CheB/CheR fusion protein